MFYNYIEEGNKRIYIQNHDLLSKSFNEIKKEDVLDEQ